MDHFFLTKVDVSCRLYVVKAFLLLLCISIFGQSLGQGLELMPEDQYNELQSPALDAGGGNQKEEYVIPQKYFPPPQHQGNTSSCVGWSVGYAYLSFYHAAKGTPGLGPLISRRAFSPWYLYENIVGLNPFMPCNDCNCNTRIDLALDFLQKHGNVPMYLSSNHRNPCNIDSRLNSTAVNYKIGAWTRVESATNLNEIKSYLLNDMPVIASIKTDASFEAYKDTQEKKPYKWSNNLNFNKHAILIVGYSDKKHAIKILNSYGSKWGSGGYGWIDYDSYNKMITQAFIVQKDYLTPTGFAFLPSNQIDNLDDPSLASGAGISEHTNTTLIKDESADAYKLSIENQHKPLGKITAKDFAFYGKRDSIRKDRYRFTFGLDSKKEILDSIIKTVYVYDHPTFINKYSTSSKGPHFENSYDGWGCLTRMSAIIHLANDSTVTVSFNGCKAIDYTDSIRSTLDLTETSNLKKIITPYTTIDSIAKDKYRFKIQLLGIEKVKDDIDKVVYNWNHFTFKNKETIIANGNNNYTGSYTGWGCLTNLIVTVIYKNGRQIKYTVDMCKQLGLPEK